MKPSGNHIELFDLNPMKVSHCAEFKAILIHIQDCCDPYMMCQEKYCVTSQQYMRHMVYCEGCEICDGLKEHYYHFAYEKVKADQRKQEAKIKRQQELAKIHNKFEMAVDYH